MSFSNSDADLSNLYSNAFGYLRMPLVNELPSFGSTDVVDVVVTGVPFDVSVSGRPGARYAPSAIRRASANLAWEPSRWPWNLDWREHLRVLDTGDIAYEPGSISDMMEKLQLHAARMLLQQRALLTFGGDHLITLPLLRELRKCYGKLALVHFDSHTDTEDGPYNHGTVFQHALREGLVDPTRCTQVGIRTWYERKSHPYAVLDADWCHEHSAAAIASKITEPIGDLPVYISVDIDVLDPAFAPGTGAPVIGGLTSSMLLRIIRSLSSVNIIGMDVVEVCPPHDVSDITSLAAATVGLEFLCLLASRKAAASHASA